MGHEHHHGHNHGPASYGRAFAIGLALNLAFVTVEFVAGHLANSLALVADAGHNLSDVLGLALAWGAATLARRTPTPRRTYGLRRSSILAAVINAVVLLVSVGAIAWEAFGRLQSPAPVASVTVIWIAAIGIVINAGTALLFASGRKSRSANAVARSPRMRICWLVKSPSGIVAFTKKYPRCFRLLTFVLSQCE